MNELISAFGVLAALGLLYVSTIGAVASMFYSAPPLPEMDDYEEAAIAEYRAPGGAVYLNSSADVYRYVSPWIGGSQVENLMLLLVTQSNVLAGEIWCTDDLPEYVRLPRIEKIVRFCQESAATTVICVHNHPNGSIYPSNEDVFYTSGLAEKLHQTGISLRDHVIVTKETFYSLRENCPALAFRV